MELLANVFSLAASDMVASSEVIIEAVHNQAKLALRHTYLLHELLAVSALQIFCVNEPRRELLERAAYHQGEALRLVRPHITSPDPEHYLALLFFASYAARVGLAEAALGSNESVEHGADPVDKMIHVIGLTRGIRLVITPAWEYLKDTWAWPVMRVTMTAGDDLKCKQQDIPGYWTLRSLAFGIDCKADRQACVGAVEETCRQLSLLQQRNDNTMSSKILSSWPMAIEPEFVALLRQRKPVALVVLAYYAVLLKLASELWWVRDWPVVLLKHIETTLGEEWSEFLRWPKEAVFGNENGGHSSTGHAT